MPKRLYFISLAILLFLVSAGYVLTSLLQSYPPSVIVITVESLRNDLATPVTTPHLFRASLEGRRFTRHRAVSGWTGSNIVSLLTGLTPFASGVHTRGQSVESQRILPLELLAETGYRVEGIQGFMMMDIYRNLGLTVKPETNDLLYSLSMLVSSGEPFFTWYHYVHTHLPYATVGDYETSTSRALSKRLMDQDLRSRLQLVQGQSAIHYDQATFHAEDTPLVHALQLSSIREFDDWFKGFWDFFVKSGLQRNTILVVTADHGDEHAERGLVGHASTTLAGHLHEEIVRVPFIIWLPPGIADNFPDVDLQQMTTHEDLMPTILDLLGQKHQQSFKGRNIFTTREDSTWLAMTSSGGFAEPDPDHMKYFEYGVISGSWKLLYRTDHGAKDSFRLYNLDTDPGENDNLAPHKPLLVGELFRSLSEPIRDRSVASGIANNQKSGNESSLREPVWVYPSENKTFSYNDLQGNLKLEWNGSTDKEYILEYIAGIGGKQISGSLVVKGTVKDFGKISRRYWETWIVPYSPFRIRVSETGGRWSSWLALRAKP